MARPRKAKGTPGFPTGVRIFGKDFSVKYGTEAEGFVDAGEMDENTLGITVQFGQPLIEEMDTLLHEVLHGIDFVMTLNLTEEQVRSMATGLIGVFQDNPDFAKFVTRPL